MTTEITFQSLCEDIPERSRPPLDWAESYVDIALQSQGEGVQPEYREALKRRKHWRDNGFLILRNFIPAHLIDAYCARYEADNGKDAPTGYPIGTPYMQVDEIKRLALYAPLQKILTEIIGEPVGMNLNLCNWVSTERNWHQDDYLNPPEVNGHYLACWFALDAIRPDAGPFEFVPGSHKWPVMRGDKVRELLEPHERTNPDWPRIAERFLDDIFEAEIEKRGAQRVEWLDAQKGDVLIWHAWLAHRGSRPRNPGLLRKSLIVHYSGINHRPDMQKPALYENGESEGYYFPF